MLAPDRKSPRCCLGCGAATGGARRRCDDCAREAEKARGQARRDAKRARGLSSRPQSTPEQRRKWAAAREANRAAKPWLAPGITPGEKYRLRYSLDPEFNLRERMRAQLRDRRKVAAYEKGLRSALKGRGSGNALFGFLGYTAAELRRHFERQFEPGMSWARFAAGDIHIGHRVPLSRFDLSVEAEIRAAWALANLQPEWAADNLKRGAAPHVLL